MFLNSFLSGVSRSDCEVSIRPEVVRVVEVEGAIPRDVQVCSVLQLVGNDAT